MTMPSPVSQDTVKQLLARWTREGLITPEEAARIIESEGTGTGTREQRRPPASGEHERTSGAGPLVAEGLGYVGGVLILVAGGVLFGRYFDQLSGVGRVVVTGLAAALLVLAGGLVRPERGITASGRLRSVLWLLAVGVTAGCAGLLAHEVGGIRGLDMVAIAAAGATALAAELWRRHRWILQQAAVVAGLGATVAALAGNHVGHGSITMAGGGVWAVGVGWLLLGALRVVTPRYAADLLGALAVTVGGELMMDNDAGAVLALVTVSALVATGVWRRTMVLLVVGSVGTLLVVPGIVGRYFEDSLAAPLALLVAGAVLVVLGVLTARRRRPT